MKAKVISLIAALGVSGLIHANESTESATHISVQFPNSSDSNAQATVECVILLHGLARTSTSMTPLSDALVKEGYLVVNVDYPSREFPIATLAEMAITPALATCRQYKLSGISFITHSLGGILVRGYLSQHSPSQLSPSQLSPGQHSPSIHQIPELKRVVMLAPPNKGSEVVDNLRSFALYKWLNGPAGDELGTDAESLPQRLGPVDFDLGVIAGTTSINLLLSIYLPNPDDGKVSVESTKIEGMQDFIALPVSHPYIMKDKESIAQAIYFLRHGQFLHTQTVSDE